MAIRGAPVTVTACPKVAVNSTTSPTLLVVAPPAVTVTVGSVRLMSTPVIGATANPARSASLLAGAASRMVPPFRLMLPTAKVPAAKTSAVEAIV